jgi:hypothetical protein
MTDFSVLRSRLTTPDDTVGVGAQRITALSGHRGRSTRLVRQIGFALATLTWDPRPPPPTSKPKSLTTLQGEPS